MFTQKDIDLANKHLQEFVNDAPSNDAIEIFIYFLKRLKNDAK
jgi:hypothetical protein